MKLAIASALTVLVLALAGCAQTPARGGSSAAALGGSGQAAGTAGNSPDMVDYRQILAAPGPF